MMNHLLNTDRGLMRGLRVLMRTMRMMILEQETEEAADH